MGFLTCDRWTDGIDVKMHWVGRVFVRFLLPGLIGCLVVGWLGQTSM